MPHTERFVLSRGRRVVLKGSTKEESTEEAAYLSRVEFVLVRADSTQILGALTLERLFAWHTAIFPAGRSGLVPLLVGAFRGGDAMQIVSGAVGREKVHCDAPPCGRLDAETQRFLQWLHSYFRTAMDAWVEPSLISPCRKVLVSIGTASAACGRSRRYS
jgi:hypothetical protein